MKALQFFLPLVLCFLKLVICFDNYYYVKKTDDEMYLKCANVTFESENFVWFKNNDGQFLKMTNITQSILIRPHCFAIYYCSYNMEILHTQFSDLFIITCEINNTQIADAKENDFVKIHEITQIIIERISNNNFYFLILCIVFLLIYYLIKKFLSQKRLLLAVNNK